MTTRSILECERKQMDKWSKNRLPNQYKKWGVVIAIISFLMLFINKFALEYSVNKNVFGYGMLIGLLIISISKEKVEDEWVTFLRSQSYTFAFVCGVVFSMIQPLINYGIDLIAEGESAVFKDNGDFVILWLLLFAQVAYFEVLKKVCG